jgi:hypothetical protein
MQGHLTKKQRSKRLMWFGHVFQERSGFLKVGGEERCSCSLENASVKNVEKDVELPRLKRVWGV